MSRHLQLLNTSIVVELLRVPYESDRHEHTLKALTERETAGVELQLPVAAILETGAHVGRIVNGHDRRGCAERFDRMIRSTLGRETPWTFTTLEWDEALLVELIGPGDNRLQPLREYLATQQLETGDLLIVSEFRRIRDNLDRRVVDVDVWTYDAGLRSIIDVLRS